MNPYHDAVGAAAGDAEQLELTYQAAVKAGEGGAFKQAIEDSYAVAPENPLYAAWFHRLKNAAAQAKSFAIAWGWALPLAIANGLLLYWLSEQSRFGIMVMRTRVGPADEFLPLVALAAAPICAVGVLTYLAAAGRKPWYRAAPLVAVLLAAVAYVVLAYPRVGTRTFQQQYLVLMLGHLPVLAWASVGVFLTAGHREPENRFAFLTKSLELSVLGGLFVIAGGLFTAITFGLFGALDVELPGAVMRLIMVGGAGAIPLMTAAVVYDPTASPAGQAVGEGLSKTVATMMRALLPLTLAVLLTYLAVLPFNFRAPYYERDVLIIYNAMLFAVIALIAGATPLRQAQVSARMGRLLRLGIIVLAASALVVGLHALWAILSRTSLDRLTPNRLAFIGWSVINVGLLGFILIVEFRASAEKWVQGLWRAFSAGTVIYVAWTLVIILVTPWLFRINQGVVGELPPAVQDLVYEQADPILLKCIYSHHIYLLDGGKKRWIANIDVFEDRGYAWSDVRMVGCEDLRQIDNGVPIPPDAGPPPQP